MGKLEWRVTDNRGEVMGEEVKGKWWAMRMEGQGWGGGVREKKKTPDGRNKIPYVTRMENQRREGILETLRKAQKGDCVWACTVDPRCVFGNCNLQSCISSEARLQQQLPQEEAHPLKHQKDLGRNSPSFTQTRTHTRAHMQMHLCIGKVK